MEPSFDRGALWKEHRWLLEARAKEVERQCFQEHGWCPLALDELLEAGEDGLTDSVLTYDRTKGATFVTHAWHRIKKPMMKRIAEALKRDASLDAPAKDARSDTQYFDGIKRTALMRHEKLEDKKTPRPDIALASKFAGERELEIHELVENEAGLTAQEQKIIRQFFGLNSNGRPTRLKEIASKRGISSARASQIKEKALEKIRAAIDRRWTDFVAGRKARDPFLHPF